MEPYAEEVLTRKFKARRKTYYINLMQNQFGRFIKIKTRSGSVRESVIIGTDALEQLRAALEEML